MKRLITSSLSHWLGRTVPISLRRTGMFSNSTRRSFGPGARAASTSSSSAALSGVRGIVRLPGGAALGARAATLPLARLMASAAACSSALAFVASSTCDPSAATHASAPRTRGATAAWSNGKCVSSSSGLSPSSLSHNNALRSDRKPRAAINAELSAPPDATPTERAAARAASTASDALSICALTCASCAADRLALPSSSGAASVAIVLEAATPRGHAFTSAAIGATSSSRWAVTASRARVRAGWRGRIATTAVCSTSERSCNARRRA